MRSKSQRKTVKVRMAEDDSVWNIKSVSALLSILIVVSLLIFAVIKVNQARLESIPKEFEGRIVDKWAGFSETEYGSYPYYRVVVEIDGKPRIEVPVNKELYDQAQVGMRLKRSDKGLQIIRETTVIK